MQARSSTRTRVHPELELKSEVEVDFELSCEKNLPQFETESKRNELVDAVLEWTIFIVDNKDFDGWLPLERVPMPQVIDFVVANLCLWWLIVCCVMSGPIYYVVVLHFYLISKGIGGVEMLASDGSFYSWMLTMRGDQGKLNIIGLRWLLSVSACYFNYDCNA